MNAAEAINLTIGIIALEHYLPAKRRRRRANTVDGYENSIRLHVLPKWGGMTIPEITKAAVQEWVDGFEVSHNGNIMLSVNRSRMMVWDTANDKNLWRVTY